MKAFIGALLALVGAVVGYQGFNQHSPGEIFLAWAFLVIALFCLPNAKCQVDLEISWRRNDPK